MILYLGDGTEFVPGIPARDLTEDEWAALGEEAQAFALASGLYAANSQ